MITKKLDNIDDIAEESTLLNSTIEWWKKEMSGVVERIDELNEQDPMGLESGEEREHLEKKIDYLVKKGEYENKNILELNSKIDVFVKKKKDKILGQLVSALISNTKGQKGT